MKLAKDSPKRNLSDPLSLVGVSVFNPSDSLFLFLALLQQIGLRVVSVLPLLAIWLVVYLLTCTEIAYLRCKIGVLRISIPGIRLVRAREENFLALSRGEGYFPAHATALSVSLFLEVCRFRSGLSKQ